MGRPRASRSLAGTVALGVALTLSACGQRAAPEVVSLGSDETRVTVLASEASAVPDLVRAADALGLAALETGGDATTVVSPASLQVALSMLAEGAEGGTLTELEALVGADGSARSDGMNALTASLDELDGDPAVVGEDQLPETPVVHRASQVVLDDSLTVEQGFLDALARSYGATAQTTDLAGDVGAVLDPWVEEHTGGLVPRSAVQPSPDLRLVLQDAIVLAARWEQPFPGDLTLPQPFTTSSGEEVEVDMMDTGGPVEVAHAEVDGWQAVRLPYVGQRLAADVLLPPEGTSPTALPSELSQQIRAALDEAEPRPVRLRMPVVEAASALDLVPFLSAHAPSALAGGFGGITEEALAVGQATQQGVLSVDEEGTRAAAVTEVGMGGSAAAEPPLDLLVDRPYLLRVADGQTGWPLFLASVTDPRGD